MLSTILFIQKCRSISTYKASLCLSSLSYPTLASLSNTNGKNRLFRSPQTEAPGYTLPPCFRSYKYHPREARFAHHLPGLPPHLPETPAVNSGAVHLDSALSGVLYFVSDIKIPGTPAFPAARPSALPNLRLIETAFPFPRRVDRNGNRAVKLPLLPIFILPQLFRCSFGIKSRYSLLFLYLTAAIERAASSV